MEFHVHTKDAATKLTGKSGILPAPGPRERIDFVSVATPNHTHFEFAKAANEAHQAAGEFPSMPDTRAAAIFKPRAKASIPPTWA
jgi:hypothetical protein